MRQRASIGPSAALFAALLLLAACGMTLPDPAQFVYSSPDVLTYPEVAGDDAVDAGPDGSDAVTDAGDASTDAGDASTDAFDTSTDTGDASTDGFDTSTDAGDASTDGFDTSMDAGDNSTDAFETSTDAGDTSTDGSDAVTDADGAGTGDGDATTDSSDAATDGSDGTVDVDDGDALDVANPCLTLACEDSNPCTLDGCDPSSGCTHLPQAGTCSDGNDCTEGDSCQAGSCTAGSAKVCNDGNLCTTDSCVALGGCATAANSEACDDGNACTTGDACVGGACGAGAPTNCADNNACTNDACDPPAGCTYTTVPCDDGLACTADTCNSATGCVHTPGEEVCNGLDDDCDGLTDENVQIMYFVDGDGDGYGGSALTLFGCTVPSGYVTNENDCNDANSLVHPGALEICNGIDDDCNGVTDESGGKTYYFDGDGDGYGNPNNALTICQAPPGYVGDNTDCNDTIPSGASQHPGAMEICDGLDNNCNGKTDEGFTLGVACGWGACAGGSFVCTANHDFIVCSTDGMASSEKCNGIDDNCDGATDEGVLNTYYQDADGDGYGKDGVTKTGCSAPAGYVDNNGDCNDTNPAMHPAATEICNSLDDNCNGLIDEGLALTTYYQDADSDGYGTSSVSKAACAKPTGYVAASGDCDDTKAAIHPNAQEICDNVDNNCGGGTDEGCDDDNDDYCDAAMVKAPVQVTTCKSTATLAMLGDDCDDTKASVHPGAPEVCGSGVDSNCDGQVGIAPPQSCYSGPAGTAGVGICKAGTQICLSGVWGFCAGQVMPGVETCNGADDDCDGSTDEGNPGGGLACVTGASGVCAAGMSNCVSGALVCTQNVAASAETCNGQDDDCDGATDNGTLCEDGNACTTDSCTSGACAHPNAGAGIACTGGACDGVGSCQITPAGMGLIPAGTFWMGCNSVKDSNCASDESPQHKVTLSAYYMDLTETTVGQYKACVAAGVCTAPSSVQPATYATYPGLTNNPVNFVSWAQSQQYCKWRGAGFDLPTEAQWEMAARGSCEKNGSTAGDPTCAAAMRTYPWGEAAATCSYAVMTNGTSGCGTNATLAVGSKTMGDSPYGLHDMAGSVWEWVRDWYVSYSPGDQADPAGPVSAVYRVFRGGAFDAVAVFLRVGVRPNNAAPDASGFYLGLRCSRPFDLCSPNTCDANATCGASTGCVCNPGFFGDGTTCTCGGTVTSTTIGGVARNVCAYDYPVWGNRPDSPNTYTVNGDGTVSDSQTKLMWQQATSGTYTWADAGTYCDGLTLAGHDDWRLPTVAEGESLVDYTLGSPEINATAFPGATSAPYWTSVVYSGGATYSWYVNLVSGSSFFYGAASTAQSVRCVRANAALPPPVTHFAVSGIWPNATVLDNATGLNWQQSLSGSGYTWSASAASGSAQAYCNGLSYGGYSSGWRVPTERELFSIVDRTAYAPAINLSSFPSTPATYFWSATSWVSGGNAWYVSFVYDGNGSTIGTSNTYRVRCVR